MWKLKYVSGQYNFNSLHNFFSLDVEENKDKKEEAKKKAQDKVIELKKEAVEVYGNPEYYNEFQLVWIEDKAEKEVFDILIPELI
ncbi:MAG: hypothetical protein NDI62_01840 [Burkholderiales bacterium]|nr:hypothetical protein [Burkholderiales bacterium]